jgi:hypothetical protein
MGCGSLGSVRWMRRWLTLANRAPAAQVRLRLDIGSGGMDRAAGRVGTQPR